MTTERSAPQPRRRHVRPAARGQAPARADAAGVAQVTCAGHGRRGGSEAGGAGRRARGRKPEPAWPRAWVQPTRSWAGCCGRGQGRQTSRERNPTQTASPGELRSRTELAAGWRLAQRSEGATLARVSAGARGATEQSRCEVKSLVYTRPGGLIRLLLRPLPLPQAASRCSGGCGKRPPAMSSSKHTAHAAATGRTACRPRPFGPASRRTKP